MKTIVKYLDLMPQIESLITEHNIQWVQGLKDSKNWRVWNICYFTQHKRQLQLPHVQTAVKLLNSTVTFWVFCLLVWGALVGWLLVYVSLHWRVSKIYPALWQWVYCKKLNHISKGMQREVALKSLEHFIYLMLPSRVFNLLFMWQIMHWYHKTYFESVIPRHLHSSLDTSTCYNPKSLSFVIQDWITISEMLSEPQVSNFQSQVPQTGDTALVSVTLKGHGLQSSAKHCRTPAAEQGQLGATQSSLKLLCIRSSDRSSRAATQQLIVDAEAEGALVRSWKTYSSL